MASKERWGKDEIVQRIQKWNFRYGRPPKLNDWRYSGADADGSYPSEATVKLKFGAWNTAINQAGLQSRAVGRPTIADSKGVISGTSWDGPNWGKWPYTGSPPITWYPYTTTQYGCVICEGRQKKLDSIKAILEAELKIDADVLLAIINA